MWHNQGCHIIILPVLGMKRQKTVYLVAKSLRVTIVKPSRLCGWPNHRRLLIKDIHHDDYK